MSLAELLLRMSDRPRSLAAVAVLGSLCLFAACTQDAPTTGPDAPELRLPTGETYGPGTSSVPVSDRKSILLGYPSTRIATSEAREEEEEFNCTNVEDVRVRFGPPGFVEWLRVGLFVEFRGMPPEGEKLLRLWWDYDNHGEVYQDVDMSGGTWKRDDGLYDFDDVIEHEYSGITGPTELKVRVELILDGKTGNCARNRRVTVMPDTGGTASYSLRGSLAFLSPFYLYRDVYRIVAPPGTVLTVSVDTLDPTTTFDPYFVLDYDPPVGFTLGIWFQDDDFGCTYPPPAFSCPQGSFVLPPDPDGTYYLAVSDTSIRFGSTGGYVLRVSASVPIPPPVRVENDTPY